MILSYDESVELEPPPNVAMLTYFDVGFDAAHGVLLSDSRIQTLRMSRVG
jgi:hypothetical protein